MTIQSSLRHYTKIVRHFASTRAPEVFALQASPILGCVLGGLSFRQWGIVQPGLLLIGSLALTAHIFVFNDWVGYSSDIHDPRRTNHVSARQGISRHDVAVFAVILLLFAIITFALVGRLTLLFGMAIAALSFLYSCSPNFGKSTPIMGSINHLLGGMLHFLLGYTWIHTLDANGIMMSLFFGLVFAGGHLNQEVRDYEGDLLNGIRTTAVVFGCRATFLASFWIFTAAYMTVASLALFDILPIFLLWTIILWILHVIWSIHALQCGLGFETAKWIQERYRVLFALVGLAMLLK